MKDILRVVVLGALFIVPFLTLYVANDYFFPYITGKNFAFRIIVEVAFAAWILLALLDAKYRPKFSWVIASFSMLIIVMFFSSLFAEHQSTAFFSNFERMDGYITLAHVFLYVLVLGSMLVDKQQWRYFFYTTLTVAFFASLYGIGQYLGVIEGYRGRIDGQLGNAAYMAIYMLFHIFIAWWMFVESKQFGLRVLFGLLSLMFIFTLIETGTRGTALGLIAGISVMLAYIALFGKQFIEFRKYAIGAFAVVVLVGGTFIAFKDSEFVQNSPNLARIANISFSELSVRTTIWGMAFEGVKERPILGWGQGNFNYVFNEQYDPALYGQEQWFDRTHNIVLDWLIAGGVIGFVAYVSLFVTCLYYLVWRPFRYDDQSFDVLERGVLIGILVGYATHNLVVFDNIISYIFFAVILAFIHSRVGSTMPRIQMVHVDEKLVTQFAAPIVAVVLVAAIYTLHLPNMNAATDIIDGYRATTPEVQYEAFDRALSRGSFAQQEIVEQVAQQAMNLARNEQVSPELRKKFLERAEAEMLAFIKTKPGDARLHVFLGTFYRSIGVNDKAAEQMALARSFSPRKQAIIAQQGVVELARGDYKAARDFFEQSYELDTSNPEAREYFAASLFYTNEGDAAKQLMTDEATRARFAQSDFMLSAVNSVQDFPFLLELYKKRVELSPLDVQNWASLAFLYNQTGDKDQALATLDEAAKKFPSFTKMATCVSDNLRAGRDLQAGCQ